jgi:DNA-binding response OmpR family regulator
VKALLIEDDLMISDGIARYIARSEISLDTVHSLTDADHAIASFDYEIIILDLNLPDGDGLQFLKKMRASMQDIPVLILTARDQPRERVQGLNQGADDYLAKPFDMEELVARLRALLRRRAGRTISEVHYGSITLLPQKMEVQNNGTKIDIPISQFRLLQYLIEAQGAVKTKLQIIETLYSWDHTIAENTIEVYVSQLRKALGKDVVRTIRGIGYASPLVNK